MASIQPLVSPLTGRVSYRVQVRLRGYPPQSGTFRNRKDAERWASSIESGIREGRHFPHALARRTSFAALAERYVRSVLADAPPRDGRTRDITSPGGLTGLVPSASPRSHPITSHRAATPLHRSRIPEPGRARASTAHPSVPRTEDLELQSIDTWQRCLTCSRPP